jgi:hypothetical protein
VQSVLVGTVCSPNRNSFSTYKLVETFEQSNNKQKSRDNAILFTWKNILDGCFKIMQITEEKGKHDRRHKKK